MNENIILNENDEVLNQEDIDHEKGYLETETRVIAHHEAVEEVLEINHLAVKTFYFSDGTSFSPETEDDPHILMKDDQLGIVDYINLPGEEEKEVRGIDMYTIIDQEHQDAKEAWDETEVIQRYILYTEEELQKKKEEKEREAKKEELLNTGLNRIETLEYDKDMVIAKTEKTDEKCNDLQVNVDDLTLMLAEMVAM